jgi:hypothetical protein
MKTKHQYKVSGAGWLCVWSENTQRWVVLFELTPQQLRDHNEQLDYIKRGLDVLHVPANA